MSALETLKAFACRAAFGWSGAWIGSGAVVMADVGRDTIVGAGAVVTRPLPDRVVACGVPARILHTRDEPARVAAHLALMR